MKKAELESETAGSFLGSGDISNSIYQAATAPRSLLRVETYVQQFQARAFIWTASCRPFLILEEKCLGGKSWPS